jgi:hypothetical protein
MEKELSGLAHYYSAPPIGLAHSPPGQFLL